jgi:hypothetical protein
MFTARSAGYRVGQSFAMFYTRYALKTRNEIVVDAFQANSEWSGHALLGLDLNGEKLYFFQIKIDHTVKRFLLAAHFMYQDAWVCM